MGDIGASVDLLGRSADLDTLVGLLQPSGPALINVTGARGVGKSALIRTALGRLGGAFGEMQRLDLTGESAATALAGLRHRVAHLPAHLPAPPQRGGQHAHPPLLMYLDRADCLARSPRELTRLVEEHAGLRLLVESVPPLRDPGCTSLLVGPLDTDAAVELLRQSALKVGVTIGLDRESTAFLIRMTRAVDANPLALDLAAARLPFLPLPALTGALESPTRALSTLSAQGGPDHGEPAIRILLADSYRATSVTAQALLDHLSVFTGSFTFEAVQAVWPDGPSLIEPLSELLDLRLIELDTGTAQGRYRLSRLVQGFATEHLLATKDDTPARQRHADYYRDAAHRAARAFDDAEDDAALAILGEDYPEAVAALAWLRSQDPAAALRLAADLAWEAHRRGGGAMVVHVLDDLVNDADNDPSTQRDALLWLVQLASWTPRVGDQAQLVDTRLGQALTVARRLGEPLPLLGVLRAQYFAVTARGDLQAAIDACTEGMAVAASIGHARWLGRFEISLAAMHGVLRQYESAAQLASSGLARAIRSEDRQGIALGTLALHTLPAAFLTHAGTLPSLPAVLTIFRDLGDLQNEVHTLTVLAHQAIDHADPSSAARWILAGVDRLGRSNLPNGLTLYVMLAVHVARLRGDHAVGARLHGSVASHMEPLLALIPAQLAQYQAGLAEISETLGQNTFDANAAAGRLWDRTDTLLELVAYLRVAVDEPTGPTSPPRPSQSRLTPREEQVLALLARGLRNKEIAVELGITAKSVMHHTVSIYRKLGVRSRTEAVAALASGAIRLPS